jgi:hypothetical protein
MNTPHSLLSPHWHLFRLVEPGLKSCLVLTKNLEVSLI